MVREDAEQLPPEVLAFVSQLEKVDLPFKPLREGSLPQPWQTPYWVDREEWARFQEQYLALKENFMRWFLYELECETFATGYVKVPRVAALPTEGDSSPDHKPEHPNPNQGK